MTRDETMQITGPAVVSFSGGRTSGYMLWRILEQCDGTLMLVWLRLHRSRHSLGSLMPITGRSLTVFALRIQRKVNHAE